MNTIIGQSHLIGEMGIISKLISNKNLNSIVLYGSPGVGKSTLAKYILNSLNCECIIYNAAIDSTKKLKEILVDNCEYFILEEIHQLNKSKQNILLPYLENNKIKIIGCTTENPFQFLIPALRSRLHLFKLKDPTISELVNSIQKPVLNKEILNHLAIKTGSDIRYFLNSYNLLTTNYQISEINISLIDQIIIKNYFSNNFKVNHYNYISGLQKSIRHSDLDSALYYLALLSELNDLKGLLRRLAIIAAEDVGIANPNLVSRTINLLDYCEKIGFPEANYLLSMIVFELALSPKSTISYKTFLNCKEFINNNQKHQLSPYIEKSNYVGLSQNEKETLSYANLKNAYFWKSDILKPTSKYEKAYFNNYIKNRRNK
jgi:putative ATPase